MGCLRGMSSIRHTRSVFTRPLIFGPIFLKFFLERYCNGRKDRCAVLDVIMIAFFPRNIVKFSFCLKSARKY